MIDPGRLFFVPGPVDDVNGKPNFAKSRCGAYSIVRYRGPQDWSYEAWKIKPQECLGTRLQGYADAKKICQENANAARLPVHAAG